MDLTPEQQAAVIDMAERYMARRARQAKTGAAVMRNDWTDAERDLYAARNDLKSELRALARANTPAERALRESNVAIHRARVAALEG